MSCKITNPFVILFLAPSLRKILVTLRIANEFVPSSLLFNNFFWQFQNCYCFLFFIFVCLFVLWYVYFFQKSTFSLRRSAARFAIYAICHQVASSLGCSTNIALKSKWFVFNEVLYCKLSQYHKQKKSKQSYHITGAEFLTGTCLGIQITLLTP